VNRELHLDGPYGNAVTPPKSVYVMSMLPFDGVWYSRPNASLDPITQLPAFPSGPGLAYGIDLADGGPQAFAAGSVLSVNFADGLKRWNGASFVDAGSTQLKAFRGSNATITTPPENFGVTTDVGPFDSVSLPAVAASYGADGAEVHNSIRFAMLGDGTSPTSAVADGVYSLKLQLSSTQPGLAPSDPYYFVLYKNAGASEVIAAVRSLSFGSSAVQWMTPEPSTLSIIAFAVASLVIEQNSSRRRLRW
jgi:hypothetical protein